ncbi:MAG: PHP domain-containing protein [Candidatus Micrarchaeia archaeon]
MIRLEEYKHLLLKGDWHVHSNYVDGKSNISQLVRIAKKNNLKAIVIVEHVRKKMDYNFDLFLEEVNKFKNKYDIEIFSGVEAKVIDEKGNLDLPQKIWKDVDVVLAAFHSFKFPSSNFERNFKKYEKSLRGMLKNKKVNIWAHPFSQWYERLFLSKLNMFKLVEIIKKRVLIVEINLIKFFIPPTFLDHLINETNVLFSIGSDAHAAKEIWNGKKPTFINNYLWNKIQEKNLR